MHETRARVLVLLQRHGWNATSFQILEAGFSYWFFGDDACVAYVDTGAAWVAAGAPIASPENTGAVAKEFVLHAGAKKRRVCFFATEARFKDLLPSFSVLHIGEQAVWDPKAWPQALASSRGLREQVRRARAKGVGVRALTHTELVDGSVERTGIEALIARWLATKSMAPMGFLVDVEPFTFASERRYFCAERDGALVGFLAVVPVYARGGWLFEDLIRDQVAPNGTSELLIDAAMRAVATEGSGYVTLGLAPLAGVRGWLRFARDWSSSIYDFSGLHAFKARLRPQHWESIGMAFPPGASANAALYDVLSAFARGSFARFGLRTLLRGPALVVRTLAVLLIPWTVALALLPSAHWFPWSWLKWAWVGFDAALVGTLLSLATRWRRWLGAAAAGAVSADAVLTSIEVASFNAQRAQTMVDYVVLALACAAPAAAAVVLWGALARQSLS